MPFTEVAATSLPSSILDDRPWCGSACAARLAAFYDWTSDGTRYQLTPYMHVVVIYGYDDWGVYVSDPGNGALDYWDWAAFEGMWGVMDGMALSVHW